MAITIPAKRTGPKVRTTAEQVENDKNLCEDAVGTRHQWGRGAVLRLKADAERLGVKIEFKEEQG
jgi:hypothetical protein